MLFASVGCMTDYDQMVICNEGDAYQVRGRTAAWGESSGLLLAGGDQTGHLKAATGATSEMEATWTSFNG
jgi:hypothetical protein